LVQNYISKIPEFIWKNIYSIRIFRNLFIQALYEAQRNPLGLNKDSNVEGHASTRREGIENWAYYTGLQSAALKSIGVKPYFFIQPIPAFAKTLSSEEKMYFERTPSGAPIYEGQILFPKISSKGKALSRNLNVYDLTGIFRNEKETVYIDECCHMNYKGISVVAEKIVWEVSKAIGPGISK
jgi:hypothetical protein